MVATDNTEERVRKIIVEQLGVDASEVNLQAQFVNDLGADSLDTVELVMALEEEFDITIPDEEVGDLINYKLIENLNDLPETPNISLNPCPTPLKGLVKLASFFFFSFERSALAPRNSSRSACSTI